MQMTVREVARLLKVVESDVQHWVADQDLPATEVNGLYRFNCAEVLEWATSRKMPIEPSAFPYSDGRNGDHPDLLRALELGGILYDVPGTDRQTVLAHVIAAMPLPDEMERDFLLEVFLSREGIGSTNIGQGIALPHPRYPNVVQIAEPFITLAFLQQPIVYSPSDAQPVHTLFALVSPTVRGHLGLLALLATALRDGDFQNAIAARRPAQEILEKAAVVQSRLKPHETLAGGPLP
jgi:PTS system nitrogen regulatory IIA component